MGQENAGTTLRNKESRKKFRGRVVVHNVYNDTFLPWMVQGWWALPTWRMAVFDTQSILHNEQTLINVAEGTNRFTFCIRDTRRLTLAISSTMATVIGACIYCETNVYQGGCNKCRKCQVITCTKCRQEKSPYDAKTKQLSCGHIPRSSPCAACHADNCAPCQIAASTRGKKSQKEETNDDDDEYTIKKRKTKHVGEVQDGKVADDGIPVVWRPLPLDLRTVGYGISSPQEDETFKTLVSIESETTRRIFQVRLFVLKKNSFKHWVHPFKIVIQGASDLDIHTALDVLHGLDVLWSSVNVQVMSVLHTLGYRHSDMLWADLRTDIVPTDFSTVSQLHTINPEYATYVLSHLSPAHRNEIRDKADQVCALPKQCLSMVISSLCGNPVA